MIYSKKASDAPTTVPMRHNLEEIPPPGLELFDLTANESSVEFFIDNYIPTHWHAQLEIFLLLEGETVLEVEDQRILIKQGEGCFINTGVLHAFRAKEHAFYHSIIFDASIVGGAPGSIFDVHFVQPLLKGNPFCKIPKSEIEYIKPFQEAFSACETENPGYQFVVRDALSKILIYLLKRMGNENASNLSEIQNVRIKQCLSWIDANLSHSVFVSDIASSANISVRECQRLFKACLHRSPNEYLLYRRLMKSVHYLVDLNMTVTEAAFESGFDSPSYFTKKFKELIGMTPSDYKKLRKKKK